MSHFIRRCLFSCDKRVWKNVFYILILFHGIFLLNLNFLKLYLSIKNFRILRKALLWSCLRISPVIKEFSLAQVHLSMLPITLSMNIALEWLALIRSAKICDPIIRILQRSFRTLSKLIIFLIWMLKLRGRHISWFSALFKIN